MASSPREGTGAGRNGVVGRAIVEAFLSAGARATTVNRGQTGEDVPGAELVRGDRESERDVTRLARSGSWDVVVDTSGCVPRNTLTVMRLLEPVVARASSCPQYACTPAGLNRSSLRRRRCSRVLLTPVRTSASTSKTDQRDTATRSRAVKLPYVRHSATIERRSFVRAWYLVLASMLGGCLGGCEEWRRAARSSLPASPSDTSSPSTSATLPFALMCAEGGLSGAFNVTAPIEAAAPRAR